MVYKIKGYRKNDAVAGCNRPVSAVGSHRLPSAAARKLPHFSKLK